MKIMLAKGGNGKNAKIAAQRINHTDKIAKAEKTAEIYETGKYKGDGQLGFFDLSFFCNEMCNRHKARKACAEHTEKEQNGIYYAKHL